MPYVHLSTSKSLDETRLAEVRECVARHMPLLPGKSKENTMIQIDESQHIFMGSSEADCLFADVRLYQASPAEAESEFFSSLAQSLGKLLDIPVARIYMNLQEMSAWCSGGVLKK